MTDVLRGCLQGGCRLGGCTKGIVYFVCCKIKVLYKWGVVEMEVFQRGAYKRVVWKMG